MIHFRLTCILFTVVGLLGAGVPGVTSAQTRTIRYDGRLEHGGEPVSNAAVPMQFSIFPTADGGQPLWTMAQPAPFAVNEGAFTVELGAGSAGPVLAPAVFAAAALFVETRVSGVTLAPRRAIGSVPFAVRSETAVRALNAPKTYFAEAASPQDIGANRDGVPVGIPGALVRFDLTEMSVVDITVTGSWVGHAYGVLGEFLQCGLDVAVDGQMSDPLDAYSYVHAQVWRGELQGINATTPYSAIKHVVLGPGQHVVEARVVKLGGPVGYYCGIYYPPRMRVTVQPE